MTDSDDLARCTNCGREFPAAEIDPAGWCAGCRHVVVRRSTIVAHVVAALATVVVGLWIVILVHPGPRFAMLWLMLMAAIYFVLFKLARRVAFEAIRSRGVRPPEED